MPSLELRNRLSIRYFDTYLWLLWSFSSQIAGIVFPFGNERRHVGGEFTVKVHLFAGLGVDETQRFGMEGLAGTQFEAIVDELGVT